jgi:hypothetical protein
MKRVMIAAAFTLASLGASCGLQGDLERPAPMWGSERTRWIEAKKKEEAEAAAAAEAKKNRPRVEIPVAGAGSTTPSASASQAGQSMILTAPTNTTPADTQDSGGASPPVAGYDISQPQPN